MSSQSLLFLCTQWESVTICAVLQWLEDESREKKKETLDTSDWHLVEKEIIPQQGNGYDCGIFSIICAD
ncbi:hypothetical protein B484DRAFT_409353 [Ochromonadaceae sp. CCMP2298]|nr:hypothetical protein B484DRAFT_409353 [Ochromonadaceae sp. CCMP2298]